jgi:hypothetical protein
VAEHFDGRINYDESKFTGAYDTGAYDDEPYYPELDCSEREKDYTDLAIEAAWETLGDIGNFLTGILTCTNPRHRYHHFGRCYGPHQADLDIINNLMGKSDR